MTGLRLFRHVFKHPLPRLPEVPDARPAAAEGLSVSPYIVTNRSLGGIPAPRRSGIMSLGIAALLIAGGNVLSIANGSLHASQENQVLASAELDPSDRSQLMYEIMIAELAGRRGYLDIANEGYNAAAKRTTDPRVSERATKLAVFSRNWDQAEEAGIRWSKLDEGNPEVHQILSQVYLRKADPASAAIQLSALIDNSDEEIESALQGIYSSLIREPDKATALSAMSQLRDRFPQEVAAHLGLSRLALAQGDRETALEAADEAVALDANDGEAMLVRAEVLMSLGRGVEGLEQLEAAVERNPDDVNLHLGLARLLVDAGRYDEAAVELDSIFEKAPDDAQAIFTIGLLGLESKRNVAAERYFKQLLTLGEYESEAHYYIARIADSQQEYKKAISHYEQVLAGDSFVDAQIRAAELYGMTDQVELARERLQMLTRNNGDPSMQPRFIRAEARILRESGDVEEAISVLTGGLEKFPENGDLLYTRALIAERHGDKAMFESDLRTLIANEPENAHALNALGYFFVDANVNLEEAEELLVKANALLPQDAAILDSVGWLYYRQGKIEEALEYLRQAYEQFQDAEIAAHLGEVLWVSGEQESAREVWDKAVAESPEDAKLKSVIERFVQ